MTGTFEGVGSLQFSPDNKYAYAYSGNIPATTALVEYLTFNNNSEYIIGTFQFNGCVNDAAAAEGDISVCIIKLDGVDISTLKVDTEDSYNGLTTVTQDLIIPPFSLIQCSVISRFGVTNCNGSLTFTGKVSGAIEQENLESISDNNKWASL